MAQARPNVERDPEFDPPAYAHGRRGRSARPPRPGFEFPERYQRLVANPFLAIVGLVVWVVVIQHGLPSGYGVVDLVVGMSGLLILLLFQYHCLDCGATGRLGRARNHDCPAVRARRAFGRERRFRGPTPWVQTVLLIFALMVGTVVAIIATRP